jgi:hypothetical protein
LEQDDQMSDGQAHVNDEIGDDSDKGWMSVWAKRNCAWMNNECKSMIKKTCHWDPRHEQAHEMRMSKLRHSRMNMHP